MKAFIFAIACIFTVSGCYDVERGQWTNPLVIQRSNAPGFVPFNPPESIEKKRAEERERKIAYATEKAREWRTRFIMEACSMAHAKETLDDICDAAQSKAAKDFVAVSDAMFGLFGQSRSNSICANIIQNARMEAKALIIDLRQKGEGSKIDCVPVPTSPEYIEKSQQYQSL